MLYSLLGDLPAPPAVIKEVSKKATAPKKYLLEELSLKLNPGDPVDAFFVKPLDTEGKLPTVIFSHTHGGVYQLGKSELLKSIPSMCKTPYAEALTGLDCNIIAIDHLGFESRSQRTETDIFKEKLWYGQNLWGLMVYDSLRIVDYLHQRPDVDTDRIAALGMSMGSTMSWWLTALDKRVKLCIDICCLTDFTTLLQNNDLKEHGIYYYVPALLKYFSTADINSLIAPRAHLALAGIYDKLTPVKGLDIIDNKLKKIYQDCGAENNWRLSRYKCAHQETEAMRREIINFIKSKL